MLGLKPERFALQDFSSQPISVCGKSFIADQSGALYWGAEKALVIADLHLEKGSSFAARGVMLPPYDTRATLMKLADTIDRYVGLVRDNVTTKVVIPHPVAMAVA